MDAHLLGVKSDEFRVDRAACLKDGADLFQDSDFHNLFRRRGIPAQLWHAALYVNVCKRKPLDIVVKLTGPPVSGARQWRTSTFGTCANRS